MHTAYRGATDVLPLREQARVVNTLLRQRLDTLLSQLMRETGLDMWLIICHEDNYDPVFRTLTPWEVWAPILQMIVFYDRGPERGVERLNISLTNMQGMMDSIWSLQHPDDQWAMLRQVIAERQPRRIGINRSDVIWAADGLTAALEDRLIAALGPELSARLCSAEPLVIRWLETHLPEELDLYTQVAALAHCLIAECFSRAVITPGVTTVEDLRWAYWQRVADLGLTVSFPPFSGGCAARRMRRAGARRTRRSARGTCCTAMSVCNTCGWRATIRSWHTCSGRARQRHRQGCRPVWRRPTVCRRSLPASGGRG